MFFFIDVSHIYGEEYDVNNKRDEDLVSNLIEEFLP